jgi:transcriptional regulator with XRE-family HTH domain
MTEPTPSLTRLQEQIDARRKQMGLSMRELSLKAGLNETAIKAIMGGRSVSPRGATLQAIARALNTTVQDLIGQSPDMIDEERSASFSAEHEKLLQYLRDREHQLDLEFRIIGGRIDEVREVIALLAERKLSPGDIRKLHPDVVLVEQNESIAPYVRPYSEPPTAPPEVPAGQSPDRQLPTTEAPEENRLPKKESKRRQLSNG